jgi:hypothetical protein
VIRFRVANADIQRITCVAAAALLIPLPALCQRDYVNSHAGRPLRVEDAVAESRGTVELILPAIRWDRLDFGATRWRSSPAVSYSPFSGTSVELGGSFVFLERDARPRGGLSGIDVSVYQRLKRGSSGGPVLLAAGDFFLPAGPVRSGGTAGSVRALATQTVTGWRFHTNALVGRYNVAVLNPAAYCRPSAILVKLGLSCDGSPPPVQPGGPCLRTTWDGTVAVLAPLPHCASTAFVIPDSGPPVPLTLPRQGWRWSAGLAIDRDLPSLSTLLLADVFAARLSGVQPRADWIAEVGARHAVGPRMVVDASLGRRFMGSQLGWSLSAGVTTVLRTGAIAGK